MFRNELFIGETVNIYDFNSRRWRERMVQGKKFEEIMAGCLSEKDQFIDLRNSIVSMRNIKS